MGVGEALALKVGERLAKLLIKKYLGLPGETLGTDLVSMAAQRISDRRLQRLAGRRFEEISERVVDQLLPIFESADRRGELAIEPIILELSQALDRPPIVEEMLAEDLDPKRFFETLRTNHRLPEGQYSSAEEELFRRALFACANHLTEVAADLPTFRESAVRESLERLRRLEDLQLETVQRVRHI